MNPARGWNPDLEESYLPEYREFKAKGFTKGTQGFYLCCVKISATEPSSISRYSECTQTTSFSILGFFRPEVKLGFDFLEVLPNQKSRPWSLNFVFWGGEKSYARLTQKFLFYISPNFSQQKLKMPGIKFCFDRKMCPSMESYPRLLLLMIYGERAKN